jgi:acyl-CoA synthetase (NDP forming)
MRTRFIGDGYAMYPNMRRAANAVVNQAGVVTAVDLEEMVDIATAFYFLPPIRRGNVGVVGGSGGSSVLGADLCEEAGLNVIPLPDAIRQQLKEKGNAIWDWIGNPADFSISMGDDDSANDVTVLMAQHPDFDMIMTFVSGPWRRGPEPFDMEKHLARYRLDDLKGRPVIMIFQDRPRYANGDSEYDQIVEDMRTRFIGDGYAMYPNMRRAANAVGKMIGYYQKREA